MEGLPHRGGSVSGSMTSSLQSTESIDLTPDNDRVATDSSIPSHIPRHPAKAADTRLQGRSIEPSTSLMNDSMASIKGNIGEFVDQLAFVWEAVDPIDRKLPLFLGDLNSALRNMLLEMMKLEPFIQESESATYSVKLRYLQQVLSDFLKIPEGDQACVDQARAMKNQLKTMQGYYAGLPDREVGFNLLKNNMLQTIEQLLSRIEVHVEAFGGNLKPAIQYLDNAGRHLDEVERGIKSLSPFSPCLVSRADEVGIQIEPDILPPQLAAPGIDLPKMVADVRFALDDVKGEMNRDSLDYEDFYHCKYQLQTGVNQLMSGTEKMEAHLREAQQKSWLPITLTDLKRGLSKVRRSLGSGLSVVFSGVMKLCREGGKGLHTLGRVVVSAIPTFSSLLSGIATLTKNTGYYAGVSLLVPFAMIRQGLASGVPDLMRFPEVEGDSDLVDRMLSKSGSVSDDEFQDSLMVQPEELDSFDPLKNDQLKQAMQETMTRYPQLRHVGQVMSAIPEAGHSSLMGQHRHQLEQFESRFTSLVKEFSEGHLGLRYQARRELEVMLQELSSLEDKVRHHQGLLSPEENMFWSDQLSQSRQMAASVLSAHASLKAPGVPAGALERSLGNQYLEDEVIRCSYQPAKLAKLFSSAREVHDFIRQRLPRLRSRIEPQQYRVIEAELFFQMKLLQEQQAESEAEAAFERRFHGCFRPENVNPSMAVDRAGIIADIQKSLRAARDQVNHQLTELTTCEVSSGGVDLKVLQNKEQLIRLQGMISDHLDRPDLIESNLHYFVGNDLDERDITSRLSGISQQLDQMETQLTADVSTLNSLETQLEDLITRTAHLKSRLSDMYYQGWLTQDGEGFNELDNVRDKIRHMRHSTLKTYEMLTDRQPEEIRKGLVESLEPFLTELQSELPGSQRIPAMEQVLNYVRDHQDHWNKACWLELNWLCCKESLHTQEPIHRFYASLQKCARECGAEAQGRLNRQVAAFKLASPSELQNTMQQVWAEWQHDHSAQLAQIMPNQMIQDILDLDSAMEPLLTLRSRVLSATSRRAEALGRGQKRLQENTMALELFYQDVLERLAFDRKVELQRFEATPAAEQNDHLMAALNHYQLTKTSQEEPVYPLITRMSEQARTKPFVQPIGFETIYDYAVAVQGQDLDLEEKQQVMMLYLKFRDEMTR